MILQFGTSRFLQAHVDLFASEAREAGQAVPDIVIVQVSGDPDRARRLPAFADPAGFPVQVRGLGAGRPVDRRIQVRGVVAGLSARSDWPRLRDLFVDEATHVVSNTGDAGCDVADADRETMAGDQPPVSFCGMLEALLRLRWAAGRPGVSFLPCELRPGNGDTLRRRVRELAFGRGGPADFLSWLDGECRWANTLVDRIVSAPLEPAGAVAEPYALWAVQRRPGLVMPFSHPAIVMTDDLEPFERLKLHILNLGHSWLVEAWRARSARADLTVREALAEAELGGRLVQVYEAEVIPGFVARGLGDPARRYVASTLERFANPYLDHRLADIAQHHEAKIAQRIGGFIAWIDDGGIPLALPALRAAMKGRVQA